MKQLSGANELKPHRETQEGLLTKCLMFGAIALFVVLAIAIFPVGASDADPHRLQARALLPAFLLNIALILLGWRRSSELARSNLARSIAEAHAESLAYVDHTTGLANRRRLFQALEALAARGQQPVALLLIDLDRFKKVNDLYGHAAGDTLLKLVAGELAAETPSGACVARLGGDEFAIVLSADDAAQDRVAALVERILTALCARLTVEGEPAHISASVGISLSDTAQLNPASMLRRSDIAMYEAKRAGRNCSRWFDAAMETQLQERSKLEADMRKGLEQGEFVPFFQPMVRLDTGEIKGFEVLARWQHPERGLMEPSTFIPVAEATGLIANVSLAVMEAALREAQGWENSLVLAVNISPVQFKDPLLAVRIVKLLTQTGFPAARLEVEITESSLMEDTDLALETIEGLKAQGISISLDDFGTGYASLTQLRSLPFDRIKIDRSFVAAMVDDEQSSAIVNTITNLGSSLRLPITAEGVETEAVRSKLRSLGCSDAQGWLFGKPVPAEEARGLAGFKRLSVPSTATKEPQLKERRDQLRRAAGSVRALGG